MNADELISMLLDNDKIKNGRLFEDKIYRDEPIIQTASKLAREKTPDKISQMRQMAYTSEAVWKTEEWLFCEQGKFMEKYDDCFEAEIVDPVSRPTYQKLSGDELRGYFTWRGKIRRGEEAPECETFIFLYAFELINLIGAESPEDAFGKLLALYRRFSGSRAGSRLHELLNDMCVYYRLPDETRSELPANDFDEALISFIRCAETDDERLFGALKRLSDYKLESSTCCKKHPGEFAAAACCAVRALSEHYKESKPLHIQLFGMMLSRWYIPFRSAVFVNRGERLRSFEYEMSEVRKYVCTKGIWQTQSYITARSKRLGAAMKTVDHILRKKLGIKGTLKKGDLSRTDEEIITKALDGLLEQQARAAMPKIDIDLSKLGEIRRSADITRDRLIVEEEFEAPPAVQEENAHAEEPAETFPENGSLAEGMPLDETETAFLSALLYGGDIGAAAAGTMVSLLADSINEKLFDMFGDTVIDFDGDDPYIIEDYEEELKGKIPR